MSYLVGYVCVWVYIQYTCGITVSVCDGGITSTVCVCVGRLLF